MSTYSVECGTFIKSAGREGKVGFTGLRLETNRGTVRLYSNQEEGKIFVSFLDDCYSAVYDSSTGEFKEGTVKHPFIVEEIFWAE